MKLYQLPNSHYSAKVKIVLLEKGLSFDPQPTLLPGTPQQRARSRWLSRFHDLYLGPQLSTLYLAPSKNVPRWPAC